MYVRVWHVFGLFCGVGRKNAMFCHFFGTFVLGTFELKFLDFFSLCLAFIEAMA